MNAPLPLEEPVAARDYLRWLRNRADGVRRELVDGRVVTMNAERVRHSAVKLDVAVELRRAIGARDLDCTVFGDGATVVTDESNACEPDATVQCGGDWDPDALVLERPVIIVEVLSPTTESRDTGSKLVGYLGLDSVRHYLLADTVRRTLVHHAKADDGTIATRIARDGALALDPPGIEIDVAACFASLSGRDARDRPRG